MKRKIKNVFAKENYHCFACSPHNKDGLQLEFYELDEYIQCDWVPSQKYEGYPGAIHGGIEATLLDEVGAWTMYIKGRCSGVTSRMNIKYRKPLESNQKEITLRGKLKDKQRNICYIDAELLNEKDEICVEAALIYFTIPQEKAIETGFYPAHYDDFFDE
jgi:acyl-coenzyme A thioesterase PaaI-like protein